MVIFAPLTLFDSFFGLQSSPTDRSPMWSLYVTTSPSSQKPIVSIWQLVVTIWIVPTIPPPQLHLCWKQNYYSTAPSQMLIWGLASWPWTWKTSSLPHLWHVLITCAFIPSNFHHKSKHSTLLIHSLILMGVFMMISTKACMVSSKQPWLPINN